MKQSVLRAGATPRPHDSVTNRLIASPDPLPPSSRGGQSNPYGARGADFDEPRGMSAASDPPSAIIASGSVKTETANKRGPVALRAAPNSALTPASARCARPAPNSARIARIGALGVALFVIHVVVIPLPRRTIRLDVPSGPTTAVPVVEARRPPQFGLSAAHGPSILVMAGAVPSRCLVAGPAFLLCHHLPCFPDPPRCSGSLA